MTYDIQNKAVNWQNGMKISKEHLEKLENWVVDSVRDAASLGGQYFGYGLLPGDDNLPLDLTIDSDEVVLHYCRAITPNGSRIAIDASFGALPHYPLSRLRSEVENYYENEFVFDVWVCVNPFDREPVGAPNPSELPPRHPFAMPKYSLDVIASGEVKGFPRTAFHLLVGKLIVKGANFTLDENYMPACISIESHPNLLRFHGEVCNKLDTIRQNAILVYKNTKAKSNFPSSLDKGFLYWSENLAFSLANSYDFAKEQLCCLPPKEMLIYIKQISRNSAAILEMSNEKDAVFDYIRDPVGVLPSRMENAARELLDYRYNPDDLPEMCRRISQYTDVLNEIFTLLPKFQFIKNQRVDIIP